jgi:hypothetical protein
LCEGESLDVRPLISHQHGPKLSPSSRLPNIDQRLDTASSEGEHGLGSLRLELGQQSNRWNPWKLANHACHSRRGILVSTPADRHQNGRGATFLEIADHIIHRVAVQSSVQPLARSIDPQALRRSKDGRDGREYRPIVECRRHER